MHNAVGRDVRQNTPHNGARYGDTAKRRLEIIFFKKMLRNLPIFFPMSQIMIFYLTFTGKLPEFIQLDLKYFYGFMYSKIFSN